MADGNPHPAQEPITDAVGAFPRIFRFAPDFGKCGGTA
jgi:hypothetical protein